VERPGDDFLALAASERAPSGRPLALADVKDSWWSEPAVGRFYSFATAWILFSLFRLGNGIKDLNFKMSSTIFFYPHPKWNIEPV
jgi:hypothetical protein